MELTSYPTSCSFQVSLLCVEGGISKSPGKLCKLTQSLTLKSYQNAQSPCFGKCSPFIPIVLMETLVQGASESLPFIFLLQLPPGFLVRWNCVGNENSSSLHKLRSPPPELIVCLPSSWIPKCTVSFLAMCVRAVGGSTLGGTQIIPGLQERCSYRGRRYGASPLYVHALVLCELARVVHEAKSA